MKKRFIAFMGNLPFDASQEDIIEFFSGCGVPEVRLRFDKQGKPRGFAFVEFSTHEEFQKALRMHHGKLKGRRVNIEVTAGGGGNNSRRQAKIKAKNEKIQRFRETIHEKSKEFQRKTT